jgi:hypothetical protein
VRLSIFTELSGDEVEEGKEEEGEVVLPNPDAPADVSLLANVETGIPKLELLVEEDVLLPMRPSN